MEQFRLPTISMPKLPLPQAVQEVLNEAEEKLAHRPKLLQLFKNCFPNTLETTTKLMDDGTTFVITGDIPASWLRDSVEQVMHYVPFAKNDPDLQRIIGGLIKRHIEYIHIDPYANAFNETANDWHWSTSDITEMSPGCGSVNSRSILFVFPCVWLMPIGKKPERLIYSTPDLRQQ